jgi:hypothetical protein
MLTLVADTCRVLFEWYPLCKKDTIMANNKKTCTGSERPSDRHWHVPKPL